METSTSRRARLERLSNGRWQQQPKKKWVRNMLFVHACRWDKGRGQPCNTGFPPPDRILPSSTRNAMTGANCTVNIWDTDKEEGSRGYGRQHRNNPRLRIQCTLSATARARISIALGSRKLRTPTLIQNNRENGRRWEGCLSWTQHKPLPSCTIHILETSETHLYTTYTKRIVSELVFIYFCLTMWARSR